MARMVTTRHLAWSRWRRRRRSIDVQRRHPYSHIKDRLEESETCAQTRIRVVTGEQVVDLGDDLVRGHHFGIVDRARA